VDNTRSKARLKSIVTVDDSFAKADLVSPETYTKEGNCYFTIFLCEQSGKGRLILDDDMKCKSICPLLTVRVNLILVASCT